MPILDVIAITLRLFLNNPFLKKNNGHSQPHRGTRIHSTVAPFRAWRGSQDIVAKGPLWPLTYGERGIRTLGTPFGRTPAFQASPFSRSGTSPNL